MKINLNKPAGLEIAVEDAEEAAAAASAGADRLELCADLACGGLTPSRGARDAARRAVALPLVAMLRPRPGGFVLRPGDLGRLLDEVDAMAEAGLDGVVFGALRADGTLDARALAAVVARAAPRPVTFHRAFDALEHPLEGLARLIDLGVARVLTSGGAPRADEGRARLLALVARAGGAIEIIAGGGVRADHAAALREATGARWVHAGPRRPRADGARLTTLDVEQVAALRTALDAR